MAIPLPVALLIESSIMCAVFLNVCKIIYRKSEISLIVFAMAIGFFSAFALVPIIHIAPIVANALFIAFMILASFYKNKNLSLSIFFAIFSNIILLLAASISSVVLSILASFFFEYLGREVVVGDWLLYVPSVSITFVLASVLSHKAGKLYHSKIELLDDSVKKSMANFLAISSALTLLPFWAFTFLWEIIFVDPTSPAINALSFTIFFALLAFALLAFTNYVRKETDLRIKNEALENLQDYTRNMENMATEVRKFRHDNHNLLLGFDGFFADNDLDGLRNYYQEYMTSFKTETALMDDNRLDTLNKIGSPVLKGLVAAKLLYAQQLQIDFHVDIPCDVDCIGSSNQVDLCRIVGNLLDNAIEACAGNPCAALLFGVAQKSAQAVFVIENTLFVPPPPDTYVLYEKGFSTKGNCSGIGLFTVSQILKRNETLSLETKIEPENFVQILTLQTEVAVKCLGYLFAKIISGIWRA